VDLTFQTLILLPIGLGLLGFIEPCTVGSHLIFLGTQERRSHAEKINAVLVFVMVRTVVVGSFGAFIAFLGHRLIGIQTSLWLVFGFIYLAIGLAFLFGPAGVIKKQIDLAPATWKHAQNPFVLGLAFGLNIPACAAPILFGLLGLAATSGTLLTGFMMMTVFGLALSLPLIVFAAIPKLTGWLDTFSQKMQRMHWILASVFISLGLWSVWFGLYVDPANWSGQ
jgi:cytochrome c-type biogenesis protein